METSEQKSSTYGDKTWYVDMFFSIPLGVYLSKLVQLLGPSW